MTCHEANVAEIMKVEVHYPCITTGTVASIPNIRPAVAVIVVEHPGNVRLLGKFNR